MLVEFIFIFFYFIYEILILTLIHIECMPIIFILIYMALNLFVKHTAGYGFAMLDMLSFFFKFLILYKVFFILNHF